MESFYYASEWESSRIAKESRSDFGGVITVQSDAPLGRWMTQELRRRDWTHADFARRLGVGSGTVSRWFSGRRPNTRYCDLIADVLVADTDYVLALAGHRSEDAPLKPNDPKQRIIGLVKRVRLTEDRAAGLEGTLRGWIELDRAAKGASGG